MDDSKTLDRLILADVVVAAASLSWSAHSPGPRPSRLAAAIWFAVALGTVLAWTGLLCRLRPARVLYAASWLGYLGLVALRGDGGGSAVGSILDLSTGLVGGMILAVVFFSETATRLRPFGDATGEPVSTG